MEAVFLIEGNDVYTYELLIHNIQSMDYYYPYFKTNSLFELWVNLLSGLASNNPICLIDSNINENELEGIDSQINIKHKCDNKNIFNWADLLMAINNSTSEISIFTSGTTGQPKKIIHSISTLTRTVRVDEKYSKNIWAFAYNPTHMAGLQVFFQAFENSNTIVNTFNKERKKIYELIERFQITHISATPTFYRLLLPVENIYENIERVTLGGEKSDPTLYKSINEIFPNAKINNIYASTEAGSLFTANGENFQISGNDIEKFKVIANELLIHKSLLGKSNEFNLNEEFYHSGDLIEWIDESKRIFKFISRKNELVNVGGYKVNPSEVEDVVLQIPGVDQVLVYGRENSVLGNILCADVKVQTESELTETKIRNIISLKLQDYKVPRRIKIVDSFTLTRTGKIKRL